MDTYLYHQFAAIERDHWWFRARREIVASVLRAALAPSRSRRILDIGCGTGGMLEMLTEFGNVCGADMSPLALAYCRARLGERVELRSGGLPDDLPAAVECDVVTAFDVIEHLDDDVAALKRIYQILPPGGLLVCTVPAFQFLWGPHDDLNQHRRRYTSQSLERSLKAAGFQIDRLTYFNTLLFPIVAGVRLIGRAFGGARRPPRSDFFMPPGWMNRILTLFFASEARILKLTPLPVGVSLMAICYKPSEVMG